VTPFGRRIRELRSARGATLQQMAEAIGVSAAYLSALEHGKRGQPTWLMLQRIMAYFNIIWDEAEELRALAETSGLSPEATELANLLSREIATLPPDAVAELLGRLKILRRPG